MNDTPRTNAMLTAILETHGHVGFLNCPPTWVAFARELERELNAANERIKRLESVENSHAAVLNAIDNWIQQYKAKEAK